MPARVKVYDLNEIPTTRRRVVRDDLARFLDAIREGKAAGDGVAYDSREEAMKAALRVVNRARRRVGPGDPYPGQRVWEDRGKWYWAIIPSQRRSRTAASA
jgi:hypothetical protein